MFRNSRRVIPAVLALVAGCTRASIRPTAARDVASADASRLPTGVRLDPVGITVPVGSFPLAIAVAPSGNRVALLLNGWARTGVQIVDWRNNKVTQTVDLPATFIGLVFSPDGRSLYASGGNQDAIYRYRWVGDSVVLADSIKLVPGSARRGARYPAQLALSPDGSRLYVAENLADSLTVLDATSGAVVQRLPTGKYPYGVVVAKDGTVYVSAWGGNAIDVFEVRAGRLTSTGTLPGGRHPSALLLNASGTRLFAASASTDRVTVIDTRARRVVTELLDPPPAGPSEGSTPNALTLSADGNTLWVAEADANAVGVFHLSAATSDNAVAHGSDRLEGRIPVGWYPAALVQVQGSLIVVNGKGLGTRANPDGPGPRTSQVNQGSSQSGTLGQLTGTLSVIDTTTFRDASLGALTNRVAAANGWTAARRASRYPHFEHVIYVIKENRTYDQMLGVLTKADGDTGLVYFPRSVAPHHHALSERFGTFDRFFVNAEVSADGHNWTTAAYASDYVEKTVQPNYSGRGRPYDFEGTNRGIVPANPDDDVNSPSSGYLWTLAEKKGTTLRNYGEFVVADRPAGRGAAAGAGAAPAAPRYRGVKPYLDANTNPEYPGFDLDIQDQRRADIWLAELDKYVSAGQMPALEIVRLPNDHTSGGSAGKPTPRADVADNDLALGRMIAGLSRTPFWKSTVVFVLEDDAQNGPDHVDSHRSPLMVISPYNPGGVFHRFTTTTDVIETIEGILGLGSLSQFDYYGRPLNDIWSADADLRPYDALTPTTPLTEKNSGLSRGALESVRLKFDTEDESDDDDFSQILWHMMKGWTTPYPGAVRMSLLEASARALNREVKSVRVL